MLVRASLVIATGEEGLHNSRLYLQYLGRVVVRSRLLLPSGSEFDPGRCSTKVLV